MLECSGTDATHAEHIETIKARLYVGVRPDGKFVPGELGMGLVEGQSVECAVILDAVVLTVLCIIINVLTFINLLTTKHEVSGFVVVSSEMNLILFVQKNAPYFFGSHSLCVTEVATIAASCTEF